MLSECFQLEKISRIRLKISTQTAFLARCHLSNCHERRMCSEGDTWWNRLVGLPLLEEVIPFVIYDNESWKIYDFDFEDRLHSCKYCNKYFTNISTLISSNILLIIFIKYFNEYLKWCLVPEGGRGISEDKSPKSLFSRRNIAPIFQ